MKIIRKIFGDKYYEFFIHILRYLGIIPINYNINKDLNFGSLQANSYFKNELSILNTDLALLQFWLKN